MEDGAGTVQVVPLRLEPPAAVEYLDAVALPVRHVDVAVPVRRDIVRDVELAGIGTRAAPREEQLAVRRVLVDARVDVPIGDVEVPRVGVNGDVGAAVERVAAIGIGMPAGNADRHQHPAVERTLADCVVSIVDAVDGVVRAERDGVGVREQALAPRSEESAVLAEQYHRVVAAVEDEDTVFRVDRDGGGVTPPLAFREAPPTARLRCR